MIPFDPYARFIQAGRFPDESGSWRSGDTLEFTGASDGTPRDIHVTFERLDPRDLIGFYAWQDGKLSGGWTRGRFRKVA